MGSLSNQFISQSFISLIHLGNDNIITSSFTTLQDGLGNSLNVSVNAQGDISASGNIYAANISGSAGSINTGSFVTTSSFNSYTSSTNARLSSIETSTASFSNSITSLNSATSSLQAFTASAQLEINALEGFTASIAGTNTFTASAANSISALNASSASQQLEINALEATSGSLIVSASNALYTASFNNGTRNLTFTKGDTTQFSVNIPDASGSILPSGTISSSAQISELGFVSSSVTASSLTTASLSGETITFTKGDASTFNITLPSGSVPTDITALNNFTASVFGTNAFTQSAQLEINSLEAFTASIAGTNDFTASIKNTNAFTQSAQLEINSLEAFTASIAGTNTFTASAQNSLNSLNAATSSYARLNVNNQFTTDQTITGSLVVTGTITANELHVIIESSSVIYSSGSNQLGDELTDTQILSGSTKLVGTATLNGSPLITSAETASYIQDLTALNNFTASVAGTNTFTQSAQLEINSLEAFSASALTTASVNLNTITFTKGDASTFNITVNTGSAAASAFPFTGSAGITGSLSVVGPVDSSGSFGKVSLSTGSFGLYLSGSNNQFTNAINVSDIGYNGAGTSATSVLKVTYPNFVRLAEVKALSGNNGSDVFVMDRWQGNQATTIGNTMVIGFSNDPSNTGYFGIYMSSSVSDTSTARRNFMGFGRYADPVTYPNSTGYNFIFAPSNTFDFQNGGMRMGVMGNLYVSQSFTASIESGYTWVGGPGNTTIAVATSSFAGGAAFPFTGSALITGSLVVTGSISSQATTLGTSNAVLINANSSTPIRISDRSTGDSAAIIISGSQIASRQNQIQIQNINRGRFVMGSSFAGGTNDRTVFNIEYRGTERAAINGYVGTSVGFDYQDANTSDANAIYISASRGSDSLRNFMGFNARPNEYAGSIYNYVFAPANGSLGGMRMGIFGHLFVTESFTASLQNGFAWVGDGNGYSRAVATSSFAGTPVDISALNAFSASTNLFTQSAQLEINALEAFTASVAGTNTFTQSAQLEINALEAFTASIAGTNAFTASATLRLNSLESTSASVNISLSSLNTFSASALTTASFSGNTLTFTKGDSTTFGVTIPDVSGSTINTGSFATTGSNAFFGNQTISGSVGISGSAITFVSGTLSGSAITNIGDTFTDVAPVNRIITLTSASYAALVTGSLTDPNALYIVSGSTSGSIAGAGLNNNTFSGSQVITGSVQGNVTALSIASNTASLDFNAGNLFTLTLVSGSIPTFINPTNIKAGQTISLVVTQAATLSGSLAFPTTFKFPYGFSYTSSVTSSAVDVLTFVTVNTSTIYASAVKNLS